MEPGTTHTMTIDVGPEMSAERYGNAGFAVLATPALAGLFERCCIEAMAPTMAAGNGSVGTHIAVDHLAATPLGFTVTIRCEVVAATPRTLEFKLEASDGVDLIGRAVHRRAVVDLAKFQSKLGTKTKPA